MQANSEKATAIFESSVDFLWRNYKWVCNVCLRYIYGKRPDLSGSARGEILVDACINASVDKIINYAAAKYDAQSGAETTYVTKVVNNVCHRVLERHINMESTILSNNSYEVRENTKYDDECDEVVQATEPLADLDGILKPLMKNKAFEKRIAVDYIRIVMESTRPKIKVLWKDKYADEMSYEWFRQKVTKVKKELARDQDLKNQLLENVRIKELTRT